MPQLTDDEKARLFMTLDAQTEQLTTLEKKTEKIERGMYGDTDNGSKGLIHDMKFVKAWIADHKLKVAYLTGIFTTIGFALKALWEWATRK